MNVYLYICILLGRLGVVFFWQLFDYIHFYFLCGNVPLCAVTFLSWKKKKVNMVVTRTHETWMRSYPFAERTRKVRKVKHKQFFFECSLAVFQFKLLIFVFFSASFETHVRVQGERGCVGISFSRTAGVIASFGWRRVMRECGWSMVCRCTFCNPTVGHTRCNTIGCTV